MAKKVSLLAIIAGFALLTYLCSSGVSSSNEQLGKPLNKAAYIKKLQAENGIDYINISNSTAYIPPVCWVNTVPTKDKPCFQCHLKPGHKAEKIVAYYNPCYVCHTLGKEPNYLDDSSLQMVYAFPDGFEKNPWTNLFKDRTQLVTAISDEDILRYIREDNYIDKDGEILLKKGLPSDWQGYIPDCYFNFDDEGFDINPRTNEYTGWRAFRYYPLPGFFPTNGSFDDVLIRLPKEFRIDKSGKFNKDIYKANLAIVEALIKQKNITTEPIDERAINYDLDKDGKLGIATEVKFTWKDDSNSMTYVGMAEELLKQDKVKLAAGLYPIGTEFLHSIRYIDWDDSINEPRLSKRLKELRYGKKIWWADYNYLHNFGQKRSTEQFLLGEIVPESFFGNFEIGFENQMGWVYQGFIEDKKGNLRPQTNEETFFCMGCHSAVGSATDSTFAYARKFEGSSINDVHYGWGHWSQKGFKGVKERTVEFRALPKQYEYSFYLRWTKSSDDFRMNDEAIERFFDSLGFRKPDMIELMKNDISVLLYPSKQRALMLNKAYWTIVREQSFIEGRDPNINPASPDNVHKEVPKGKETEIPYRTY